MKKLYLRIKTLIGIPLKTLKYDLINNNKKDIYDYIVKIYKKYIEGMIPIWKGSYESEEKFKEELFRENGLLDSFYKIFISNEFSFAFGFSNNKLGFQIKFHLLEDKKINFIFLFISIFWLIYGYIAFFNRFTEETNIKNLKSLYK